MEVHVAQSAQVVFNGSTDYTSGADFCRIFAEEMDSLYLLGYLLTGDAEKAEQCFVAGIGDCVEGNAVFKEWARSWARRAIVQQAIRLVNLVSEGVSATSINSEARLEIADQFKEVLRLDAFDRFVFVMSVLEGYSNQDCSLLLGCSRQTVIEARARSLERLTAAKEIGAMQSKDLQAAFTHFSN
jgi:DNA-directed RNA polymerase specialized sigma24 family protein